MKRLICQIPNKPIMIIYIIFLGCVLYDNIEKFDTEIKRILIYPPTFRFLTNVLFLDHCDASLPKCKNSGVRNHKCECYCPTGFTGSSCETIVTDSGISFIDCIWINSKHSFITHCSKGKISVVCKMNELFCSFNESYNQNLYN